MAIIKAVSSRASIGNSINYITKKEKTEEKLISGKDCIPESAIDEMKATKELWNKTSGRQYKHFVQSFSPEEKITPEQAHGIALKLAQEEFKGYEVLIATHKDKKHIHTHFIVNSVSFEDGRKFQQSRADLQKLKDNSDEICKADGLSICEKGQDIATYDIGKYKSLEKATQGKYKSYVLDAALTVLNTKKQATSRADFIDLMKQQGYETKWTDSRKYITFTDKDGNKVRNSNLEKTFKGEFGKEQLENEFDRNLRRTTDRDGSRTDSKREVARFKQAEQNRIRKQPAQGEFDGVYGTIREIEERTKRLSGTGREELRQRQRAEQAENASVENKQRKPDKRVEQQHKQLPKSNRVAQRQHKIRNKGIDFER